MPLHKVPFSVIHSTSYEEGHPPRELEIHNPLVKGWVSSRFCIYPQEFILRLNDRVRLRKLQLLSHQFLIPTKIEFFVGNTPPDHFETLHGTNYRRLGYISLSDNEKTGFKARELKSVHIDVVGRYLKVVIHKNYINKYNLFNQVGIVAINAIGEECDVNGERLDDPVPLDNDSDPSAWAVVNKPDFVSPMEDLAFDMYQDPEVAQLIRKLDMRKNESVLQEKYELAKRLKQAIIELQKVGERLGRYEVEKRRAIEGEDYDLAKVKKIQMDEYRLQIYRQLELNDLLDETRQLIWPISKESKESKNAAKNSDSVKESKREKDDKETEGDKRMEKLRTPPLLKESLVPGEPSSHAYQPRVSQEAFGDSHQSVVPDDRPLPALKTKQDHQLQAEEEAREQPLPPAEATPRSPVHAIPRDEGAKSVASEGGGGGITGEPEGMTERQMREAAASIDIFGLQLVSGMYSKTWSFREDSLMGVYNKMDAEPLNSNKETTRAMLRSAVYLLQKGLRDKVFAVFQASLRLLRMIFETWIPKHKITKHETQYVIDKTLPELLTRTSDMAPRIRQGAMEFVTTEMTHFKVVSVLHSVPPACFHPLKLNVEKKLAIGRVDVAKRLVDDQGVENGSGLTVDNVMKFCTAALDHNAGEVREKAVKIIFVLYKDKNIGGETVRDYLPPDEPAIRKNTKYRQIFEGFDKIDGKPSPGEIRAQEKRAKEEEKKKKQAQIDALQSEIAELRNVAGKHGKGVGSGDPSGEPDRKAKAPAHRAKPAKPVDLPDDTDKMCIFCGEKDEAFTEEGLDLHYWKDCPMLKKCKNCKQVVEISGLSEHLLTECQDREKFAKCRRCLEAVEKSVYDKHVQDKKCTVVKGKDTNLCPLCHTIISPGEEGWKRHLMGSVAACKSNPRREPALKRAKLNKNKQRSNINKAKPTAATKR